SPDGRGRTMSAGCATPAGCDRSARSIGPRNRGRAGAGFPCRWYGTRVPTGRRPPCRAILRSFRSSRSPFERCLRVAKVGDRTVHGQPLRSEWITDAEVEIQLRPVPRCGYAKVGELLQVLRFRFEEPAFTGGQRRVLCLQAQIEADQKEIEIQPCT